MELEHDHTRKAIRERLAAENRPNYARDFVYGGIDGAVTTFAVVAGVQGAELPAGIVVIMGLANLLADGLSMAASNYSGTKTEIDDFERIRQIEHRHIAVAPEGEREEVRQILAAKGLSGHALEEAVAAITRDRDIWTAFMLTEEYGLATTQRSPVRAAAATFMAFALCGAVPLVPYVAGMPQSFTLAAIATGLTFLGIGSFKSRWSLQPWWQSAMETFSIGTAAAVVAYAVGWLLRGLA